MFPSEVSSVAMGFAMPRTVDVLPPIGK